MTRIDRLRNARQVVQVTFAEYLKIRSKDTPTLVFEGKQCPAFYIPKIKSIIAPIQVSQLIARGKKNVIELRELIRKNTSTTKDVVLFFVDSDFDQNLEISGCPDVYITRGYAIENELCDWATIENFIRMNFDIADYSDESAIAEIRQMFKLALQKYVQASATLNKVVFVCRRTNIRCLPGEEASQFLDITWSPISIAPRFIWPDPLLERLEIAVGDRTSVLKLFVEDSDFESLAPIMQWRGKYIFSFLRQFLSYLASLRTAGSAPFKRPSRIMIDPVHPGLLAALSSVCPTPPCLKDFLSKLLIQPAPSPT